MGKISTEDCLIAIQAKVPLVLSASIQALKPGWKRRHKSGRKGGPVIRVFSSLEAPFIKAVVIETDGQLEVEFRQRHLWEIGYNENVAMDEDDIEAWLARPEVQALPGPVPGDFAFGVTDGAEEVDEGHFVYLSPITNPSHDQHLDDVVGALLPPDPDGGVAGEISESTYHVAGASVEAVKREMIRRGFIHEPRMDGEMGS